jgi:ATP-binding cassette subfamily B protein
VLDGGRIVERGTFAELISAQGVFARMWALQQEEAEQAAAATSSSGDARLETEANVSA